MFEYIVCFPAEMMSLLAHLLLEALAATRPFRAIYILYRTYELIHDLFVLLRPCVLPARFLPSLSSRRRRELPCWSRKLVVSSMAWMVSPSLKEAAFTSRRLSITPDRRDSERNEEDTKEA
eukprot:COSAG01_NODE_15_length_40797_cov_245.690550_24_plen_121_part_00